MVKNKTDFKIKDLKDINKSLTKSFKNIEKINDLNELTILHDNMMDFVIKCELTIQNSETNSTKENSNSSGSRGNNVETISRKSLSANDVANRRPFLLIKSNHSFNQKSGNFVQINDIGFYQYFFALF